MAHASRKLSNSFEGALAGGGDPATSPLYVFGPFLRLIVVAGVAGVTFGASVWLVVITIATVSAMYRLVMQWITDGSGGSGLSEEELGGWAVRVNAGITFVEYTLTFLVSVAALVTFIADRAPVLNESILGIQLRDLIAVALSVLTGWLVNRGPRVTARAFGPATAGVLLLLWAMILATIFRHGLHLPSLNPRAFTRGFLGYTFGGYARILAVMTGIEIFANLVPAYRGTAPQKSRKAFGSLIIIMGTTSLTMLIVGPAILRLSDPADVEVSVFTQTMDQLLPGPLALLGTFVGVAVLLSAAAASALGLQNLFVGLRLRRYVPPWAARLNRFGVADRPVWIEVGIVAFCFLLFGTREETYLAIYAAGVFILLSMTGWAASRRLVKQRRGGRSVRKAAVLAGTATAAALTSGATIIIFWERFTEGAWTYFLFIPLLYVIFGYYRTRLGEPRDADERIGRILAGATIVIAPEVIAEFEAERKGGSVLVPLDGSDFAQRAVPLAGHTAAATGSRVILFTVDGGSDHDFLEAGALHLRSQGVDATTDSAKGPVADTICAQAASRDVSLIVMSTHGLSGMRRVLGSVADRVVRQANRPVLVVPPHAEVPEATSLTRVLVALDGSAASERVLPYATALARSLNSEILLLHALEGSESDRTRVRMERYLDSVAVGLRSAYVRATSQVLDSDPVSAIVEVSRGEEVDLVAMATHGRGGMQRVTLGSVASSVVRVVALPVLLVPILERREDHREEANERALFLRRRQSG